MSELLRRYIKFFIFRYIKCLKKIDIISLIGKPCESNDSLGYMFQSITWKKKLIKRKCRTKYTDDLVYVQKKSIYTG